MASNDIESVRDAVASGDAAWLKVAASLRPAASSPADLVLDYAAGYALLKSPSQVLDLFGAGFSAEHVCAVPEWEPEPEQAAHYLKDALAALMEVREPRLVPIALDCLARIRASAESNR